MPSVLTSTNTLLPPSTELRVGDYTLLRQLGQGGSATIYLAEHLYLKNWVALKLLSHARADQEEVRRFQVEAYLLTRLHHRNIVQVFDFGWEQNNPFFTMAYAPGGTLRTAFRQQTPLSISGILPTILQLASALQYIHNHFTTHGDVKPENVLLGPNKEIWLGDFGIATITSSGPEKSPGKRAVRGTARYMAPEQIRGNPLPASDQYALAVMVYEWLCGQPPFHGSALEVQVQHVATPPPRLRDRVLSISCAVEHVVLKALEKDPHRRFADVIEFASELHQVVTRG
jgi:eukaryotic-like serine/threonine-protein kinase